MNIDLHLHTILTKKIAFNPAFFEEMADAALRAELDAVAMTDHFDSMEAERIGPFLAANAVREGDSFLWKGLRLFPGIEVDIAEGPHVLVIANIDTIEALRKLTLAIHRDGSWIQAERLFRFTATHQSLVICAHPFRPGREILGVAEEHLHGFDAVEINGKDHFSRNGEVEESVFGFARRRNIPVVVGSDSHHPLQVGAVYNRLPRSVTTIAELREMIRSGFHETVILPDLSRRVGAAIEAKKRLKAELLGE